MFDNWRLFVFRQLVLVVAVLSVAGAAVAAFHGPFFYAALVIVVGIGMGLLAKAPRLAIFLGLIPLLFWLYVDFRQSRLTSELTNESSNFRNGRLVVVKGILVEQTQSADKNGELVLSLDEKAGKCLVRFNGSVNLSEGDYVQAKILLDKRPAKLAAWHFDTDGYLKKRGISCSGWLHTMQDLRLLKEGECTWLDSLQSQVTSFRRCLVNTHSEYLGQTEGALLTSMVIGDRAVNLPDALIKQFRDVGLSHVLAASGFNLTIVSGSTLFLVSRLFKSSWMGHVSCFISMLAFVVMAGPSPSVLRSAFMLCVLIAHCMFARKAPLVLALSVALILAMLIDPLCITDIGFQLSYVATAAIILGVHPLQQLFPRFRSFGIVETICVILVAQMSVLPIQLYYFWSIGLCFLPANLLVAPLVHFVTLAGFATSMMVLIDQPFHLLPQLICFADKITGYPLSAILACVKYMASFEQAKLVIGAPHIICVVFYYLAFVLFLFSLQTARFRFIAGCLLIGAICLLVWRPVPTSYLVAFFKDSIAVVDLQRKAQVLGCTDAPAVRRFLLYHGAQVQPQVKPALKQDWVFVPHANVLILQVSEENIDKTCLSIEDKWQTVVFAVKGNRPVRTINLLMESELFSKCSAKGKPIWLVLDRSLSKRSQSILLGRLPSCAKIATRIGESLLFEAGNESIQIRD